MRRRSVGRALLATGAVCAAAAMLVPLGAAARPHRRVPETHITINRWEGETLAGTPYNAKAHASILHCASDPGLTLHVHGSVKHTVSGRRIVVQFLLDGRLRDSFREHWTVSGSGGFTDGIINHEGLPDGRWGLRVIQGRHVIGASWVLIEADPGC
jgi:hypothetical protein